MPHDLTPDELKARLVRRSGKTVWCLDLRHTKFGLLGRLVLRDPKHRAWPRKGRSTTDREEAEGWVEGRYLEWVQSQLKVQRGGTTEPVTVRVAFERYLEKLTRRLGARHNTVINRRSILRTHLAPLHDVVFTAVDDVQLRNLLDDLQVVKRVCGEEPRRESAGVRTKTNVRTALQAVWKYTYGDKPTPFGTVRIEDDDRKLRIRRAAERGDVFLADNPGSYRPDQILEILAHAMIYDREVLGLPNLRISTIPNTAELIAVHLGLATRIDEVMAMRWRQVFPQYGVARIPGTKTEAAWRWMVLHDCVRPWLDRLGAYVGTPGESDYLFRVDPRSAARGARPSKKTYTARISKVLERAGLKYEGEATHIFRATHITWALRNWYPAERLKRLIGHRPQEEKGALAAYADADMFARGLTAADWSYFTDLPSPAECEARAAEILRERSCDD